MINQELQKEATVSHELEEQIREKFAKCKLIHIEVLKRVYSHPDKMMIFKELAKSLKIFSSPRTLRNKIYDLREWELITTTDAGVLLIYPNEKFEKLIIDLLTKNSMAGGGVFL